VVLVVLDITVKAMFSCPLVVVLGTLLDCAAKTAEILSASDFNVLYGSNTLARVNAALDARPVLAEISH
jgi:hypothetical protein